MKGSFSTGLDRHGQPYLGRLGTRIPIDSGRLQRHRLEPRTCARKAESAEPEFDRAGIADVGIYRTPAPARAFRSPSVVLSEPFDRLVSKSQTETDPKHAFVITA